MSVKMGTAGLPAFQTLAREDRIARSVSVALVGYGRRGEEVLDALARVQGAHVAAVADIWPWRREVALGRMRALKRRVGAYETLEELLSAEGDKVDAVIVATPDWQHANHTSACLAAGKHVYCEGELAESLQKAREVVLLARKRGLLVQGGHQRRSNPRYIHAFERVCREGGALGRITHAYAQWHRGAEPLRKLAPRFDLPAEKLDALGYPNMSEFMNWEWHSQYGLGVAASLAGQKLDLMRWLWRAEPVSVSALAGCDGLGRGTPDSLMALFTFARQDGELVRGYVQVLHGCSRGGSYEQFMGEHSTLTISEVAACGNAVQPEGTCMNLDSPVKKDVWDSNIQAGRILPLREPPALEGEAKVVVDSRVSPNAPGWPLPIRLDKPAIQPHLENFVAAVRGEVSLNDPAEQAYANLVAVKGVLRSAQAGAPVDFSAMDFRCETGEKQVAAAPIFRAAGT